MFENIKLHLVDPRTRKTKWYLPFSVMTFFFAGFLFPLITRRLWGWLTVFVIYDVTAFFASFAQDRMTIGASLAVDRLFDVTILIISFWAAFVANRKATTRLLAEGWLVASETTEAAWQFFKKKWKLSEVVRQVGY